LAGTPVRNASVSADLEPKRSKSTLERLRPAALKVMSRATLEAKKRDADTPLHELIYRSMYRNRLATQHSLSPAGPAHSLVDVVSAALLAHKKPLMALAQSQYVIQKSPTVSLSAPDSAQSADADDAVESPTVIIEPVTVAAASRTQGRRDSVSSGERDVQAARRVQRLQLLFSHLYGELAASKKGMCLRVSLRPFLIHVSDCAHSFSVPSG
jgi:hypothetical protein